MHIRKLLHRTPTFLTLALFLHGCDGVASGGSLNLDASVVDVGTNDRGRAYDMSAARRDAGPVAMDVDAHAADMVGDGGEDEPCPGGRCTAQDCLDNGWLPPGNLQRDTQPLLNQEATALTWEAFFGQPFPGGNARFLEVDPDRYAAIEFETNDFGGDGTIIFDNPQAAGPWGSRLIAISQCPGYFGRSRYPDDPDCREWKFAVGNIPYSISTDAQSTRDCDLRANRTYYLNIVFVDEVLPEGSQDLPWRCALGDTQDPTWETCGALMEQTSSR